MLSRSLSVGAWVLISGGSRAAAVLRVPPVVVGLTVVAFGTSAPELFVSLAGALRGAGDTRSPLVATFCGIILGRLLPAWVFARLGLSIYWIFAVMVFDYVIKAAILLQRYRSKKWLDISIGVNKSANTVPAVDSDK